MRCEERSERSARIRSIRILPDRHHLRGAMTRPEVVHAARSTQPPYLAPRIARRATSGTSATSASAAATGSASDRP
ncbi:hypothetical protein rosag_32210 [Roseisolibacter agri]|uniref:Uncharacterized protein n=1 Tax=Roseisolibacter agri TaxID=2014610 RepID=A0AA37QJ09_9BACT|nr:hypothetical protein rosag_32210 [Roseisolibacter agri]